MAGHQNHAANAAAWAAMRAAEAEERTAYLERRRAEKAARRAANRAAWWGRMGREVPEPETALEPEAAPEPVAVARQEPETALEPEAAPVPTLSGFRVTEPGEDLGYVTVLSKDGLDTPSWRRAIRSPSNCRTTKYCKRPRTRLRKRWSPWRMTWR